MIWLNANCNCCTYCNMVLIERCLPYNVPGQEEGLFDMRNVAIWNQILQEEQDPRLAVTIVAYKAHNDR